MTTTHSRAPEPVTHDEKVQIADTLPEDIAGWSWHYEEFLGAFMLEKGRIRVVATPDHADVGVIAIDAEQEDGRKLPRDPGVDAPYEHPLSADKFLKAITPVLEEIANLNPDLAVE